MNSSWEHPVPTAEYRSLFQSNSLDLSLFRKLGPYKVQINFEVCSEDATEEIPPDSKPISGADGISLAVVIIIVITVAFFGFIIIVILVVCIVMMKKRMR
ncbi:MAG: hypothetical protein EZS28_010046, partial [Streblomastix strix]